MKTNQSKNQKNKSKNAVMQGVGEWFKGLADILRGRRWHPSQQVEELAGGRSRLRMR